VAACASWLPIAVFDAGTGVQEAHWLLRALPILPLSFVAAFAAWGRARRSGGFRKGAVRAWLAIAVGLPLIYGVGHFALSVRPDSVPGLSHALSIAIASFAGPAFIFAMCIACALLASRRAVLGAIAPPISLAARLSIGAVAASMLLVAAMDWRATRADVASTLAPRVSVKQPQLGEQLIEEAIRLLPYERHYRRQLVFDLLGRAVADMRALDATPGRIADAPDRIAGVLRNLAAAETAARAAALLFPRDPWVVAALANVLQVEALRVLRPLDPAGGLNAAQEANQLFARTHRMFPSEPLLLRNWAQLLSDQGNVPEAYRLLDLMEKLIPNDPEPYSARIAISNQVNDYAEISSTLARARLALAPQAFNQLSGVANTQQK
jgi:tetratricopeptide (TPR) repeat protein